MVQFGCLLDIAAMQTDFTTQDIQNYDIYRITCTTIDNTTWVVMLVHHCANA